MTGSNAGDEHPQAAAVGLDPGEEERRAPPRRSSHQEAPSHGRAMAIRAAGNRVATAIMTNTELRAWTQSRMESRARSGSSFAGEGQLAAPGHPPGTTAGRL